MKRKALLFTLLAGMTYLGITGYSGGPANGGLGNRTTTGCGGGGCHAANTTATTATVFIADPASPLVPLTKYIPGKLYTVTVAGTNTSGLPKFGFQVACVKASSPTTQAGTWSTGSTTGIAIKAAGGLNVVEHSSTRTAAVAGIYNIQFSWTAPAANTGTVRFTAVLNAVNGNGSESGDAPNITSSEIQETSVGVNEVTAGLGIKAYPNPATSVLQLDMAAADAGNYQLAAYDAAGRRMTQRSFSAGKAAQNVSIDVQHWAAGVYQLHLSRDGATQTLTFVKQ